VRPALCLSLPFLPAPPSLRVSAGRWPPLRRSHSAQGEGGLPLVVPAPAGGYAQRKLQYGGPRRWLPSGHRCRCPPTAFVPRVPPHCLSSQAVSAWHAADPLPPPPDRLGVLGHKLRASYPWSSPNPWVSSRESCLAGALPGIPVEEPEPVVDPVTGCEVGDLACECQLSTSLRDAIRCGVS
jgi:hypothetical protein